MLEEGGFVFGEGYGAGLTLLCFGELVFVGGRPEKERGGGMSFDLP